MPAGASMRTGMLHTSVPAVTTVSALGRPLVTTASGSRSGTVDARVYCQVPAHSGPVSHGHPRTGRQQPGSRRSTRTTWAPVGRPPQATANDSAKPVGDASGDDVSGAVVVGGAVGQRWGSAVGGGGRARAGHRCARAGSQLRWRAAAGASAVTETEQRSRTPRWSARSGGAAHGHAGHGRVLAGAGLRGRTSAMVGRRHGPSDGLGRGYMPRPGARRRSARPRPRSGGRPGTSR